MRFSRLLLVVAAALPLCACFMTPEEIAANDDADCRSAGLKPGTQAYAKCRGEHKEPAGHVRYGSAYRYAESDVVDATDEYADDDAAALNPRELLRV
jgi:hypothetical protein